MTTNRDLYLAIGDLLREHEHCSRSLETYLLALLQQLRPLANRPWLTLDECLGLLASAFTGEPAAFQDSWRGDYEHLGDSEGRYAGCRAILLRQIVDLREMDEAGLLNHELRFFGLTSPRGGSWYNFTPAGYLECAAAGAFGGWEPGDSGERQFVPGRVAVLSDDGTTTTVRPEDVARPTVEMSVLTWEDWGDFLFCGQVYE